MPARSPAVSDYVRQFEAIVADARALVEPLSDSDFNRQPAADRWSAGQCLEHLNITERSMLERMRPAAEEVRQRGWPAAGPTRHGFIMRLLIGSMEPPPKRRFRTGAAFVPPSRISKDQALADFRRLHDEVFRLLERVDGYDLGAAKVQSPFSKLLRYKLGSAFALMAAHDRRHLWQAREASKTQPSHIS